MASEALAYGLIATTTADGISITGKTFANKDRLRQCGATWKPAKKAWVFPLGFDLTPLRDPPSLDKMPSIYPWVCCRAATELNFAEETYVCATHCPAGTKPRWCCRHASARIISTKRKMYSCKECPSRDPTEHIFINGTLHTGD